MSPTKNISTKISHLMVGTRGSPLAQTQTDMVVAALKRCAPDVQFRQTVIKTAGDKDKTRPLAELGGLGVFTKEIENALLSHEIDIAVHSLKDLPTEIAPGLVIAAILKREDARDCLVSQHGQRLMQLPGGARVGTSSARRAAQVLALRPDLLIVPLRGNVDTRLRKAQSQDYDAIVIAAAGLARLGHSSVIAEYLPVETFLPDPGQGALAVEIRSDDPELAELASQIDHPASRAAVTAERAFLRALGGGCRMPIGAFASVWSNETLAKPELPVIVPTLESRADQIGEAGYCSLILRGMVGSVDGRRIVRGQIEGAFVSAEELGNILAHQLLQDGAAEILGMQEEVSRPLTLARQRDAAQYTLPRGLAQTVPSTSPLAGRKILVTRAHEQTGRLADEILRFGGVPVEFPVIDIAPLEDFHDLDEALSQVAECDWIVFTSANGVRAVINRLHTLNKDPRIMSHAKIAAIGPATAEELKHAGLTVAFVPTEYVGKQMAIEMPIEAGQSAILLRADIASETLARGLTERGVSVKQVDVYRTVMPASRPFDPKQADAVTFTSSSTVRNLVAMLDKNGTASLNGLDVFCIGPVTAETAHQFSLPVTAVAKEHTIEGLVRTIVEYYEKSDSK